MDGLDELFERGWDALDSIQLLNAVLSPTTTDGAIVRILLPMRLIDTPFSDRASSVWEYRDDFRDYVIVRFQRENPDFTP